MMNAWVIVLALQAPQAAVRDSGQEARVVVLAEKDGSPPLVEIRRRTLTCRSEGERFTLREAKVGDLQGLAAEERGKWRAEGVLADPGLYEIGVGQSKVDVWISRSDFRGWKEEVRQLQASADRLAKLAEKVDASDRMTGRLQAELDREIERLGSLPAEFAASREGLRFGASRIARHHDRVASIRAFGNDGNFLEEHLPPTPGEIILPRAVGAVGGLGELIRREAAVKLVDELMMVLGYKEEGLQVVLRWNTRDQALREIAQARRDAEAAPELEPIIEAALGKTEEDAALQGRLKTVREALIRR